MVDWITEPLESRTLLAAPVVTGERLLGSPDAITGVVLTFSEPMDPATVQDPRNYRVRLGVTRRVDVWDGFDEEWERVEFRKTERFRVTSAVYDGAARSVTLTPDEPIPGLRRGREMRLTVSVRGAGGGRAASAGPVRGADGTPLDGDRDGRAGDDARLRLRLRRGDAVGYRDPDGDRATLRLRGPGRLFVQLGDDRGAMGQVFVVNTDPARSVLDATVRPGGKGDGVIRLTEFVGAGTVTTDLLTNPAFQVGRVT